GEDGRDLLQNLDISAEPAVFAAQLRQLPPLRAGHRTVAAGPGVRLSLAGLRPRRRRHQVNILRHLADLPVFAPAPLDGLRLGLPGERTSAPGLALDAETARTQRRLGRNIGELTRWTARTGHPRIGVRAVHTHGGRNQLSRCGPLSCSASASSRTVSSRGDRTLPASRSRTVRSLRPARAASCSCDSKAWRRRARSRAPNEPSGDRQVLASCPISPISAAAESARRVVMPPCGTLREPCEPVTTTLPPAQASRAILPIPGPPRRTTAPLCPARTSAISRAVADCPATLPRGNATAGHDGQLEAVLGAAG